MNRSCPPPSGDIQMPNIPVTEFQTLANGLTLVVMRGGAQPITKLELVLPAGSLRASRALVSRATADMLNEGTPSMTSRQIAEKVEFYGAMAAGMSGAKNASYTLFSLSKHFRDLLPCVHECVVNPTFPLKEFDVYRSNILQEYEVNQRKASRKSGTAIMDLLYEDCCRHGRYARREDFLALSPQMLVDFHREAYTPTGSFLFLAGQPSDDDIKAVIDLFGSNDWKPGTPWVNPAPVFRGVVGRKDVKHDGEQTSLVMQRPMFGIEHPDRPLFWVLDTVFGGYFGSRLMQSVREKLGLTYGIHSRGSYSNGYGLHSISSEIRSGSQDRVIDQIALEMKRLREDLIPDDEMNSLRGFMLGDLLGLFSNFISGSDAVLQNVINARPADHYKSLYDVVKSVTPEQLRDVAQRWLHADAYSIAVAGQL